MIPRIKTIAARKNYTLDVLFDDGKHVMYDVKNDIEMIRQYKVLREKEGFFEEVKLDESRTCVYWSDEIDLPSDTIYEYGVTIGEEALGEQAGQEREV